MSRAAIAAATASVLFLAAAVVAWQPRGGTSDSGRASPAVGATLFRVKGCSSCHTGPDTPSLSNGLPDLSDAPTWAGSRRPGVDAAEYLAESIREPGAFVVDGFRAVGPVGGMPQLAVSDAEVDALVAYLLAR